MQHWQIPTEQMEAVRGYRPLADLIPTHWATGEAVANGIRQHYYRTGGAELQKPTLVLLHGIMAAGITWLRVARTLEAEFDVVMPDARGHGLSERISADGLSYPKLVADVAALLDVLELERPVVVGHSMGGVTAALMAAGDPERARAVVLEEAAWGDTSSLPQIGASEQYRAWLAAYTEYLRALKTQTHEERMVAALRYLPPGPTAVWPEEEYVPWVEAQAQLDLALAEAGAGLWTTMRPERPLAEVVRGTACPLLVLAGNATRGGLSPSEVVAQVVASAPDGEAVTFEDAGHLIHVDAFERYIAALRRFLARATG